MENELADLRMRIREIKSSLIVLQQAVQNENQIMTFSNIDDNLEIIIGKTDEALNNCIEIAESASN